MITHFKILHIVTLNERVQWNWVFATNSNFLIQLYLCYLLVSNLLYFNILSERIHSLKKWMIYDISLQRYNDKKSEVVAKLLCSCKRNPWKLQWLFWRVGSGNKFKLFKTRNFVLDRAHFGFRSQLVTSPFSQHSFCFLTVYKEGFTLIHPCFRNYLTSVVDNIFFRY